MSWWEIVLEAVAALVGLGALLLVLLASRRRFLTRGEATFEMSLRLSGESGSARGWVLGVGRYRGDRLQWFRVFSFALRPKRTFDRARFELASGREPTDAEAYALFSGHVVAEAALGADSDRLEVALDRESLTALLAWSEAAPPQSPAA